MIFEIVQISPVASKNFETIRTTGTIVCFHMIVLIASTTTDAGSSAMTLGQTTEFLRVSRKQAKHNDRFQSESEPRALLSTFLPILQCRQARRVPQRHSITSRTWLWGNGLCLVWNSGHTRCEYFFFRLQRRPGRVYSWLLEWGGLPIYLEEDLQRVQNRCLNVIGLPRDTVESLVTRRQNLTRKEFKRILESEAHPCKRFLEKPVDHGHNLRSCKTNPAHLRIPVSRTVRHKQSFIPRGAKLNLIWYVYIIFSVWIFIVILP